MRKKEIRLLLNEEEYNKAIEALLNKQNKHKKVIRLAEFAKESFLNSISGNGHMPAKQESEQKNEPGMIPSAQPIEDDHQPGVYDAEQDSQQDDTQSRGLFADIDF